MNKSNICKITDCGKPLYCRGWCRTHYARWKNHGTPFFVQSRKGENSGHVKLTEQNIIAIRSDDRTLQNIAADYGIDKSTISLIKRRKRWAHVK